VTPGDAFVYLPQDRVLITGDLLVNPVSFALSSYPTEWLAVLDRLDALETTVIVPGHGAPLPDKTLLRQTREVFRTLLAQGAALKKEGLDVDAARERIMPGLVPLMTEMVGDAPAARAAFQTQLVDWFLHRVYEELDGPLSDAIASIPVR
jgi:glyoxylase-like metal-dependent hydrolase (beta-lactamase superfamily II)